MINTFVRKASHSIMVEKTHFVSLLLQLVTQRRFLCSTHSQPEIYTWVHPKVRVWGGGGDARARDRPTAPANKVGSGGVVRVAPRRARYQQHWLPDTSLLIAAGPSSSGGNASTVSDHREPGNSAAGSQTRPPQSFSTVVAP